MCGIFGWQIPEVDERVIALGAILSVAADDRGRDSWGYYDGASLEKGLGFFHNHVPALTFKGKSTLVAHSRLASVGSVTVENSHPFQCGNIIGCHNGAIYNYEELNKKYDRKFNVDSQHIFAHLDEEKPLTELEGYGAIAYLSDKVPGRINLSAWNVGDLAIAQIVKKGDDKKDIPAGVVWASREPPLKTALNTAGYDYWLLALKEKRIYFVVDGKLFYETDKTMDFGPKWKATDSKGWMGYRQGGDWEDDEHPKSEKKKEEKSEETPAIALSAKNSRRGPCDGCNLITTLFYSFNWQAMLCTVCSEGFRSVANDLREEIVKRGSATLIPTKEESEALQDETSDDSEV